MNKSSSTSGFVALSGESLDSYLVSLILFNGLVSTFPDFLLVALVAESDWLSRSGKVKMHPDPSKIHSHALDSSTGIGQGRIW
jgi:hypothetical protein